MPTLNKLKSALASPYFVMGVVVLMYVTKAIAKIGIGSMVNSPMITGDGFHNIADLFEAAAVIAVIWVAKRPTSASYPFGRKNIEMFTSLFIGAGLLALSVHFGLQSLSGLLHLWPQLAQSIAPYLPLPSHQPLVMSGETLPLVLAVTAGSAVLSFLVSRYQIAIGKASGHASLVADGEETGSDGRIELVTVAGVIGEYWLAAPWLEYPLGLLVAYLIARTGKELFMKSWKVLLQHSIGDEHEEAVRRLCLETPGVEQVAEIKTFQVGHTAVCLIKVITRHNAAACRHIKYGIQHAVKNHLVADASGFKDCEIQVRFAPPEPNRYRIAYALRQTEAGYCIADGIADASRFLTCDVEHESVVRATLDPVPPAAHEFLVRKRVSRLLVFKPDGRDARQLSPHGIEVKPTPSMSLKAMDLEDLRS